MLAPNALTDYATVAADLGLSGSTDQAIVERKINAASSAIESYCRRHLAFAAAISEDVPMLGAQRLLVDRSPLVVLGSVAVPISPPDPDFYRIDDPDTGAIWSDVGWPWSAMVRSGRRDPNFTFDQSPGSEQKIATVVYAGGYITGPQAYGAAAWPGASTAISVGTLCIPAGQPTQLWIATATTNGGALVTDATEPTWPASPTKGTWGKRSTFSALYGGTSLVDGAVTWLYIGTAGSAGARGTAATLPWGLEDACVIAARASYLERGDNLSIKSESLLGASMSFDRTTGLPVAALDLVKDYRRSL